MTQRVRHYHLGCGESLMTHYNRLWSEHQTKPENLKKTDDFFETKKLKRVSAKD